MDRINHIHITDKRVFLIIMLTGVISQAPAAEAIGSSIDCSNVKINYADNPEWTHSEKVEAMNRAFFESVDQFELCNLSNQSSSSSGSGSGNGSGNGTSQASSKGNGNGNGTNQASSKGNGNGNGTNQASNTGSEAGFDSVASQEITGTETKSTLSSMDAFEDSGQPENTNNALVKANGVGTANGARPEDIPAADNDDVIEAQIRLAAEIEKDPVKKEKLWNEYRKYKGLAVNE